MSSNTGVFYGVGVGPGEFELLTLKAERVLRAADVICYPSCKPGGSSYALRIIKPMLDLSRQRLEGLLFPMDKDFARLIPVWQDSARVIVGHLRASRSVAFITEGDPMLYSTFLHVYEIIAAEFPEIRVEIIPGVSSLGAVAAAGRIALGQADEAIAIVPATYGRHELKEMLARFDTVVLMKVGGVLDQVLEVLDELGLRDCALLASRVGTRQEIVTRNIEAYRLKRLHYLTTLIVSKRSVPLVQALQQKTTEEQNEASPTPRCAKRLNSDNGAEHLAAQGCARAAARRAEVVSAAAPAQPLSAAAQPDAGGVGDNVHASPAVDLPGEQTEVESER